MNKSKIGSFCETYGATIENRVLEYLLENQVLDVAVGDMAKEVGISRPKAYEVIEDFEQNGYIVKSRVVGKTQLYRLNKSNIRIQIFLRNFEECLQLIIEEQQGNRLLVSAPMNFGMAAARPT